MSPKSNKFSVLIEKTSSSAHGRGHNQPLSFSGVIPHDFNIKIYNVNLVVDKVTCTNNHFIIILFLINCSSLFTVRKELFCSLLQNLKRKTAVGCSAVHFEQVRPNLLDKFCHGGGHFLP